MLKCPSCSGTYVSPEGIKGEKVCSTCGLVINDSNIVPKFNSWTLEWHSNWNSEEPESLIEWLTTLRTVSCQLRIPRFPYQEEAAIKIRKHKYLFLKSQRFAKNKRITIIALMHLVLKEYDKIRSIKQMCQELNIDSKLVLKQVWMLKKINIKKGLIKIQRKTSNEYLLEYATQITNKKETLAFAKNIIAKIQKLGGNPISVAAGAFYYASKTTMNPISKSEIGEVFHISPRTVETNERKIRNLMLIPSNQKHTPTSMSL
jgi:transcription initiation factor TFIIIB Brf1 subunit/transcription initiation factor TFIIB